MSFENRQITKGIVRNVNMSDSPSYYSCRSAIMDDLNGNQLDLIYKSIVIDFGEDAGKNFIEMIKDIKVLTATRFLKSLYNLCDNDWVWEKSLEADSIAIDDEGSAFCSINEILAGERIDQTTQIKGGFLSAHGVNYCIGVKFNNRKQAEYFNKQFNNYDCEDIYVKQEYIYYK